MKNTGATVQGAAQTMKERSMFVINHRRKDVITALNATAACTFGQHRVSGNGFGGNTLPDGYDSYIVTIVYDYGINEWWQCTDRPHQEFENLMNELLKDPDWVSLRMMRNHNWGDVN